MQTHCYDLFTYLIKANPSIEFCIYLDDLTTIKSHPLNNLAITIDELIDSANHLDSLLNSSFEINKPNSIKPESIQWFQKLKTTMLYNIYSWKSILKVNIIL